MKLFIITFASVGLFSMSIGFTLLLAPGLLKTANDQFNRILFTDERAIIYRKIAGALLIGLSFLFFSIAYR